jgi:hypothetical protein
VRLFKDAPDPGSHYHIEDAQESSAVNLSLNIQPINLIDVYGEQTSLTTQFNVSALSTIGTLLARSPKTEVSFHQDVGRIRRISALRRAFACTLKMQYRLCLQ